MKFHRNYRSHKQFGVDTEYYPGGRKFTFHIKAWVLLLIVFAVVLLTILLLM